MQVTIAGTVARGLILVESAVVTVPSTTPDRPGALSPADENKLLAAIAEIDRGEFVSASELLDSLRKFGWRWRPASRYSPRRIASQIGDASEWWLQHRRGAPSAVRVGIIESLTDWHVSRGQPPVP